MSQTRRIIERLQAGDTVQFRPRGPSMEGKVSSGALVTVEPIKADTTLAEGDIVYCKVNGHVYLHLVTGVRQNKKKKRSEYQISNNFGHINGWTSIIYGKLTKVEK